MITTYIATAKGSASFILTVKLFNHNKDKRKPELSFEEKKEAFINALKKYQVNTISGNCDFTISDPLKVTFHYRPTMNKQCQYSILPYKYGNDIIIEDAFACMGCKFHLDDLKCFVEIKSWNNDHLWAEVYFVTNSLYPELIISFKEITWFTED
jgi:hypothetical protein